MSSADITVIIPTLNEEFNLQELLPYLIHTCKVNPENILVVDGGSKDRSVTFAEQFKVNVLTSEKAQRAYQLNCGAAKAKTSMLYFLHADARPPANLMTILQEQVARGNQAGCFRFVFDSDNFLLRVNSWFTQFPYLWCRGGDQSLFISQELWKKVGGFDESFEVMEDFDLIERLKQIASFSVLPYSVVVSARKYRNRSWLKVMWANWVAFRMYKKRKPTTHIKAKYESLLG